MKPLPVFNWSITDDGKDTLGRRIMVRRNGKPWTRTFSMSQARHVLRRYEREEKDAESKRLRRLQEVVIGEAEPVRRYGVKMKEDTE